MQSALKSKNYTDADIEFIIEVYLGGELRGHTTHGLAPFPAFSREDFSHNEEPQVLLHTHSLFMIDAKENPGVVVGRHAADEAISIARTEGVGTAIIKNMRDWSRPGAIAQYVARHNCVGIVTNIGSGQAIAPPGGFDPTLGTNPIAYGIPTSDEPLVVEMATSKRAWGNVRMANKYGHDVLENTFYTNEGKVAIDPQDVHSVMPFGEHKGFALSFLVAVLNGTMLGNPLIIEADATSFNKPWPPNSGSIMVFNPEMLGGLDAFTQQTQEGINSILSTRALPHQKIRIPGESGAAQQAEALRDEYMEISDDLWNELSSL